MEDLSNDTEQYSYRKMGGESLLDRYKIPIQHFDFDYVSQAKNPIELERMVEVLRSGQEGHYPDLLRATEEQLRTLKPASKHLRQTTRVLSKSDLNREEAEQIANDLNKWMSDVSKINRELDQRKPSNTPRCPVKVRRSEPQPEPLNLVKCNEEKRIASATDYEAWSKYDPDAELLKQELDEEKSRKRAQKMQQRQQEEVERHYASTAAAATEVAGPSHFVVEGLGAAAKQKLKKTVSFNRYSTEAEAAFVANRESEKGREFFNGGDYELALGCFTESVRSKATMHNLSDRALTLLKLHKYDEALPDCERALVFDENNPTTLLRKALALEGLSRFEEALDCVHLVIEKDPNNEEAQQLAGRVRQHCRNILKNTRMTIVEIE